MRFIFGICIITFLLACAEKKNVEENSSAKKETIENIEEKKVVEITIAALGESMGKIAFEPSSISIPKNSVVRLLFRNNSSTSGMLHNFVLVQQGSGNEISSKGLRAGKSKHFVPKDDRVITSTKILNMGEEVTIEFDAPSKGSYHYICTFPGHTNMVGRLIVE